jgi:hypothetical protein
VLDRQKYANQAAKAFSSKAQQRERAPAGRRFPNTAAHWHGCGIASRASLLACNYFARRLRLKLQQATSHVEASRQTFLPLSRAPSLHIDSRREQSPVRPAPSQFCHKQVVVIATTQLPLCTRDRPGPLLVDERLALKTNITSFATQPLRQPDNLARSRRKYTSTTPTDASSLLFGCDPRTSARRLAAPASPAYRPLTGSHTRT